jgi:translation elongation factor P/translation initiation factor 5A
MLQKLNAAVESHIWGHGKKRARTWLERLFYGKIEERIFPPDESLTLTDLKKDEVLKFA